METIRQHLAALGFAIVAVASLAIGFVALNYMIIAIPMMLSDPHQVLVIHLETLGFSNDTAQDVADWLRPLYSNDG